ncbi:uncharacterized protein [Rutidosis leptorrhynchoides]|uniref:uncharacterized protein n=1 Tax=Rutidosis leptorrhynchoides TaxID=125765 RepID=UPI003A98EA23
MDLYGASHPFLFLIVMEGLHICIKEKILEGHFCGATVSNPPISVSHLFYAYDAIFVCNWHRNNLVAILQVLATFHEASGLTINLAKSYLYGIGANESDLESMLDIAHCSKGTLPFTYLGLQMGVSMNRVNNWYGFIERFKKKLSRWQANLLSISSQATLVKSVLGSMGIYYLSLYKCPKTVVNDVENIRASFFWGSTNDNRRMHWIRRDQELASKENGGLSIGSIHAFNHSLLLKWVWRLYMNNDAMWVSVIKAIYGSDGGIHALDLWSKIQVWVDLNIPIVSSWASWIDWYNDEPLTFDAKVKLFAIVGAIVCFLVRLA